MPQMAPLYWFTLFLFFSSIFILTTSITYFILPSQNKFYSSSHLSSKMINWKW
uniref:ATP synthase F0 subunit 8 n=1 Tax=Allanaspides hickmani TaxID=91998 RepID=UPI002A80FE7A|nr:ATP synthase F0 subunit 8 [Allanaspides hickmani]WOR80969.1 ATP synthase F0 subunit 8 [Allanaspides hickmani]WOR80982.1 ATP synthase F0 subunit 8 [Allanaspides hickmani]